MRLQRCCHAMMTSYSKSSIALFLSITGPLFVDAGRAIAQHLEQNSMAFLDADAPNHLAQVSPQEASTGGNEPLQLCQNLQSVHTLKGHLGRITQIDTTLDGKTLVSGSTDGVINIWNLETGTLEHTFIEHLNSIEDIQILSDGQTIISSSSPLFSSNINQKNILISDFIGNSQLRIEDIDKFSISLNQKWLTTSSDGNLEVWNLNSKSQQLKLEDIDKFFISSDESWLLTSSPDGIMEVWELNSKTRQFTVYIGNKGLSSLHITPDSETIVTDFKKENSSGSTLKIIDLKTGELNHEIDIENPYVGFLFHPNSRYFIILRNNSYSDLFNLDTGAMIEIPLNYSLASNPYIVFRPDGEAIWISQSRPDSSESVILEYFPDTGNLQESAVSINEYIQQLPVLNKYIDKKPYNIEPNLVIKSAGPYERWIGISTETSGSVTCVLPYRFEKDKIEVLGEQKILAYSFGNKVEILRISELCRSQIETYPLEEEATKLQYLGLQQLEDGYWEDAYVTFWTLFFLGQRGCNSQVQAEALFYLGESIFLIGEPLGGGLEAARPFYRLADSVIADGGNEILSAKIIERLEMGKYPDEYEQLDEELLTRNIGRGKDAISKLEQIVIQRRESRNLEGEARALRTLGLLHQYEIDVAYEESFSSEEKIELRHRSIELLNQALSISRELGDIEEAAYLYHDIGDIYWFLEDLTRAEELYYQALEHYKLIGRFDKIYPILIRIADIQYVNNLEDKALKNYLNAVEICKEYCSSSSGLYFLNSSFSRVLNNIGEIYLGRNQTPQAWAYFKQAVAKEGNGKALNNIGWLYAQEGNYTLALGAFSGELSHIVDLERCSGYASGDVGRSYASLEDTLKSVVISTAEQDNSLVLGIAEVIFSTVSKAEMYRLLEQYKKATEVYHGVLANLERIRDCHDGKNVDPDRIEVSLDAVYEIDFSSQEATIYNNLGLAYKEVGQYEDALDSYQKSFDIREKSGDVAGQGINLNNIGEIYQQQGKYAQSLETYERAFSIFEDADNSEGKAATLHNFGVAYDELGQGDRALSYYNQSLQIRTDITDLKGQGDTLNNIALVQVSQGNLDQAESSYRTALAARQDSQDALGEATTLNNLALFYLEKGQPDQALAPAQQALEIYQKINNPPGEGNTFDTLGRVYTDLGQYDNAQAAYQKALAILRETGNRPLERIVLSNLGDLLTTQDQSEVAIAFYKQSVNLTEQIRQDLQGLPLDQQKSYTETVADTYRRLADLLLSQGRLLEAEQVLELLKVQEIEAHTRGQVLDPTTRHVTLSDLEQAIVDDYDSLIAFAKQVADCQGDRACRQSDRWKTLQTRRSELTTEFDEAVATFAADVQRRIANDDPIVNVDQLTSVGQRIVSAQPGTVLIYPVVLPDKLWILWITEAGVPNSIEVQGIGKAEIDAAVLEFRQLMRACEVRSCRSDTDVANIQAVSQQLYGWLMPERLETELQTNAINNVVFALDQSIRYIPMAALFDGDRYLIETYTVSTINSVTLTQQDRPLPSTPEATSVLALGLSDAVPADPDAGIPGFRSLPAVPAELNAIVRQHTEQDTAGIYQGFEYLNQAFDENALLDAPGHHILHIATHGLFDPASLDTSFLMLGTKEPYRISNIKQNRQLFADISLVVLSACETGLGFSGWSQTETNPSNPELPDGREVASIAQSFINAGANTVIASLWQVSDAATSEFMQTFYATLSHSHRDTSVTIAQALQTAQLELLHGDRASNSSSPRGITLEPTTAAAEENDLVATQVSQNAFRHPYYWSPFIIIGDGL